MAKSFVLVAAAATFLMASPAMSNGLFEERPYQFRSNTSEGFYFLQREQLEQNERALDDNGGIFGGAGVSGSGVGTAGGLGQATTIGNQHIYNDMRNITVQCAEGADCSNAATQHGSTSTSNQSNTDSNLDSNNTVSGNTVTDGGDVTTNN